MTTKRFIAKWNATIELADRLVLFKQTIRYVYSNKELVEILDKLLCLIANQNEKKVVLLFARKIINQYPRKPQTYFIKAFQDEFKAQEESFAKEQKEYDPVRWVDNELMFIDDTAELKVNEIGFRKMPAIPDNLEKELYSQYEMLELLQVSKSTLDRRRADGLPSFKKGKMIYFRKSEVFEWLKSNQ